MRHNGEHLVFQLVCEAELFHKEGIAQGGTELLSDDPDGVMVFSGERFSLTAEEAQEPRGLAFDGQWGEHV